MECFRKIKNDIIYYLADKFKNLEIEVLSDDEGSLLDLMNKNSLDGWCWETTETAIVFLNDDDYILRGYLNLSQRQPNYYHSWICFKYDNEEYVLDPCLNIICFKEEYDKIFNTIVMGKVTGKEVKEELIKQIEEYGDKLINNKALASIHKLLKSHAKNDIIEVRVEANEDVNTPLYRNGAGYRTKIEDGKIKKLTAHYYIADY